MRLRHERLPIPPLLVTIVGFNLLDIPFLFAAALPGSEAPLAQHPLLVPTVILAQILLTWYFVWLFARRGAEQTGDHHAST